MITQEMINKVSTEFKSIPQTKITYQWVNQKWEEYEEELEFNESALFDSLFEEE